MTVGESSLAGGLFGQGATDDSLTDLRTLVDEIGHRSFKARFGQRGRPEEFDDALWHDLEQTGLSRLTSTVGLDAGPVELAVLLRSLAYYAGAVPVAETDLLAAWIGHQMGLEMPNEGPLTVAIADADADGHRVTGTAIGVPWTRVASAVLLVARTSGGVYAGLVAPSEVGILDEQNLAGEPRDRVEFDLPASRLLVLDPALSDELAVRGAWARCVQVIGALDAAAEATVTHCRERIQFGHPLSRFQSVQHSLTEMAGEIERGRAATELAVSAAASHGFASPETGYAVTVAKVVLGTVTNTVTTIAHQLHGAIGVTLEHRLWLSTMRAQSWSREFGNGNQSALRLGRLTLRAEDPWDVLTAQNVADIKR